MPFYYFNKNTDNHSRHEVHSEECTYCPDIENRTFIGFELSCKAAIEHAKKEYPYKDFDGCYWCCRECHKG
ncbi:hypothetical protein NGG16_16190 [Enterococcus casseliflavus]|uniref:hypothetical protein n=1 Tax=Enterococcus casseliflavus TaxID=37734 RepID=UPI002DB9FB3A|nr:hypothetical protein [Enterococcus casseliflavus]MEB8418975.1 hypothetical protein [Enterococcus casseliflavus]